MNTEPLTPGYLLVSQDYRGPESIEEINAVIRKVEHTILEDMLLISDEWEDWGGIALVIRWKRDILRKRAYPHIEVTYDSFPLFQRLLKELPEDLFTNHEVTPDEFCTALERVGYTDRSQKEPT